jgi:uncharacterized RDD family membrane protein YckC
MKTRLFFLLAALVAWSATLMRADAPPAVPPPVDPGKPAAVAAASEAVPVSTPPPTPPAPAAAEAVSETSSPSAVADSTPSPAPKRPRSRRPEANPLVAFNRDVTVAAGEHRTAVVVIGGSATIAGEVEEAVVVIGGDAIVRGPVGEAVVAVLGSVMLDDEVREAVAIGGGVELGPKAKAHDVVSVGGSIQRASSATVTGSVNEVAFAETLPDFRGLRAWVRHAFFLGRPLAFHPDVFWAWLVALVVLALYVLVGLLFPRPVTACVETLEQRPGGTILAAVLALLLSPLLMVLLTITVIGPAILLGALLLAVLVGKTALLAWIGRRTLGGLELRSSVRTALAVVTGGVILALLYTIPVLGMPLWHLSVALALGLAIFTVIRVSRSAGGNPTAPAPSTGGPLAAAVPLQPVTALESSASGNPSTGPSETLPQAAVYSCSTAVVPVAFPRAGFWIRMGALAIDGLIVLVVASALFLEGSLLLVALATYGAIMWRFRGTTVGGIVFGLKIVRLDERPVDWATSIVRALACFLSLFAAGLGFLWIIWDPERQAWHDKIAGTVVVRVPRGVSLV